MSFDGAALRHIFGVEIQHHPLTFETLEVHHPAILRGQRDRRGLLAFLGHFRRGSHQGHAKAQRQTDTNVTNNHSEISPW
jgi:hypothetical protein